MQEPDPVQTTLVIIPEHHLLRDEDGNDWNFGRITREIEDVSAAEGPQDVHVYLFCPFLDMSEVNMRAVRLFIEGISTTQNMRGRLAVYSLDDDLPTSFPRPYTQDVDNDMPADRLLVVHVITRSEMEAVQYSWWQLLSHLGIRPKVTFTDYFDQGLDDILCYGFDHISRTPFISVLTDNDGMSTYIRHFTATGE